MAPSDGRGAARSHPIEVLVDAYRGEIPSDLRKEGSPTKLCVAPPGHEARVHALVDAAVGRRHDGPADLGDAACRLRDHPELRLERELVRGMPAEDVERLLDLPRRLAGD